jgi:uncharacterized membrane protein
MGWNTTDGPTARRETRPNIIKRVLTLLVVLVILKVTFGVICSYRNYFPPDFRSEFLRGREHYFSGAYQWAFYSHVVSGPLSLILGLVLINDWFRREFPNQHRFLGRLQVACVLLLVVPSGFSMAFHAAAGPVAAMGLLILAILTGICAALGAISAAKRRFEEHRRWMWRCFLLLCSAVVLRLIGGLATVAEVAVEWIDPVATWISWMVPLAIFELRELVRRKPHHPTLQPASVTNRA